jgi:hypothetical protein
MCNFKQPVRPGPQLTMSGTQERNLFQVFHFRTTFHGATAPRRPGSPHYRGSCTQFVNTPRSV